jgi:hypothetical protein
MLTQSCKESRIWTRKSDILTHLFSQYSATGILSCRKIVAREMCKNRATPNP